LALHSRRGNFSSLRLEKIGGFGRDYVERLMSNDRAQSVAALEIRGLCKRFERPAVDHLDLLVPRGEFYALLGPNGAGKTTTLRMVVGLIRPDAGAISVGGIDALRDPVAAKQIMAWISDEPMIYDKLTPLEYLEFVAGLWAIDAGVAQACAHDLLDWLGLAPHAHERCEGFSKGMRQKVALAGALVHDPKVIVDRARRRLRSPSQDRAAPARLARRRRHHDHAHP
jgi:ABC-type Na+ transport system ATPase subunit NatA